MRIRTTDRTAGRDAINPTVHAFEFEANGEHTLKIYVESKEARRASPAPPVAQGPGGAFRADLGRLP